MGKKKKKKIRVAFRKNRQNRARQSDLTRRIDDELTDKLVSSERISGKGDLTRHRTIVGVETDESGQVLLDVDESKCLAGRVISSVGLNSTVQTDDGRRYECTVRRVVRTLARDARNAVVAGDRVLFQRIDDETGVIERVDPRHSVLSRGSQRREHILVANIDQVLIVASAGDPPLKPHLVDRFLVSAEKGGVRALICVNKADLVDPVEVQSVLGMYARLGYEVLLTSTKEQRGIGRLRELLKSRETVVAGQSGVGKSSLLNAVQPGLKLDTGNVSGWTRKGTHTTRVAELLQLDFGGWVVDTPGIRQMELWNVAPEEIEAYFIEFRPFVPLCRFPDCSHTHEDGCGVKRAVALELIHPERYDSYVRAISEAG